MLAVLDLLAAWVEGRPQAREAIIVSGGVTASFTTCIRVEREVLVPPPIAPIAPSAPIAPTQNMQQESDTRKHSVAGSINLLDVHGEIVGSEPIRDDGVSNIN